MTATDESGGGLRSALPSRWQAAVHEAAHAVYARSRSRIVTRVSIEGIVAIENGDEIEDRDEDGVRFGVCLYNGGERLDALSSCVLSLVGPTATHKASPSTPLLPFGDFVAAAEVCHPKSDKADVLRELRQADDPEGLYEEARAAAEAFVEMHWSEIVKLAGVLMKNTSLDEEDIELVFNPTWPEFHAMLDELRMAEDRLPWLIAEHETEELYEW